MIDYKEIFVNEKHWRSMTDGQLDAFADKIFTFYRENGFPYYQTDEMFRKYEFDKMMKFDYTKLIDGDIIKQSMHGLALAWSYFPHSFDVRSNNKMTPLEAFSDDKIFKKVIRKRLSIGTYISDSGIRKMLKIYSGVQGVSNFRPTAAACIYHLFAPMGGNVWDMSAGWGGRLLGAKMRGIGTYTGTEPATKTYDGLQKLSNDYSTGMKTMLLNFGSEVMMPPKNTVDLCFTSPPYFDLEKYSDEPTQSYIIYDTPQKWIDGYLCNTIGHCYYGLKQGGYMAINIANPAKKMRLTWNRKQFHVLSHMGLNMLKQ